LVKGKKRIQVDSAKQLNKQGKMVYFRDYAASVLPDLVGVLGLCKYIPGKVMTFFSCAI